MNQVRFFSAVLLSCATLPAAAQFGGLFQSMVESAAKQAVQQGVQQGVAQGVQQAVAGQPAATQAAQAPIIQNGCYFNLPPAPASLKNFNPDMNGNNCVEQGEYATYLQLVQNAGGVQSQQAVVPSAAPASPLTNALVGTVVGGAVQSATGGGGVPSVPITGKAAAWVAGQNALGAVANAAHGNTPVVGAAALPGTVNPADTNGDGVLTAQEIADHQTRAAAAAGPAGVAGQAVGNAAAGAVGGVLKGLFGR